VGSKIETGRREKCDILVGSIGGMNKMFAGQLFFADYVQTIVLDEVDTMVDDTFKSVTTSLMAQLQKNVNVQVMLAGATLPSTLGIY
jgi:superfamily II DNA/RNA helicase